MTVSSQKVQSNSNSYAIAGDNAASPDNNEVDAAIQLHPLVPIEVVDNV
jgi:hypothetical protein